jgi:hypothetical protein
MPQALSKILLREIYSEVSCFALKWREYFDVQYFLDLNLYVTYVSGATHQKTGFETGYFKRLDLFSNLFSNLF